MKRLHKTILIIVSILDCLDEEDRTELEEEIEDLEAELATLDCS